jgi:hypothetical protein
LQAVDEVEKDDEGDGHSTCRNDTFLRLKGPVVFALKALNATTLHVVKVMVKV